MKFLLTMLNWLIAFWNIFDLNKMNRNRKILGIAALVFFILLGYASYDISKRTTFPGSKAQLPDRLEKTFSKPDTFTLGEDSIRVTP